MTVDLEPHFDSRKSFYGKARVPGDYPVIDLWSYSTHVARITYNGQPDDNGAPQVFGTHSQTTLRHIKEFLRQYGFRADNAKQIMADYGVSQPAKTHQGDFV